MAEQDRNCCFQKIIMDILGNKLNLMMSEIFQLNSDVDFSDYYELTRLILKQIAKGQIESPHFTPEKASVSVKLLNYLDKKSEIDREDESFYQIDEILQSESYITDSPF